MTVADWDFASRTVKNKKQNASGSEGAYARYNWRRLDDLAECTGHRHRTSLECHRSRDIALVEVTVIGVQHRIHLLDGYQSRDRLVFHP